MGLLLPILALGCTGPAPSAPAGTDTAADTAVAADCGQRVENYAYTRAFGDAAAWNVPVCGLAEWEHSDDYVERFWFWSNDREADPDDPDVAFGDHRVDFGLGAPANDFAVPVYRVEDATTTRRVRLRNGWSGSTNLAPTDTVPWNPAWRAMGGTDASLILLDEATGREWDLWGVVQTDPNGIFNDSQCWFHPQGYDAATDLCVGSAHLVARPDGVVADYRTYEGNHPSRGVRIQHYAMVTEPAEVAAGEIRHALMMGASNTMFGPVCSESELQTDAAGSTCGFALSPAGGVEWANGPWTTSPLSDVEQRERSIPEGMRLALHLSDDEIEAWLDERGYTGQLRETARVFAVALADYGWFITDTGGTAPFNVSGAANPDTAAAWRELGIEGDGRDLLYGLITRERLWVVEPGVNACADGTTTQYACPAAVAGY
jgi:hypothetical protein